MKKPYILFQTDFGVGGGGSMFGICKIVDAELQPRDLSHTVPTFNTMAASERLVSIMPYWPRGTIFVSVVDPGVGTLRRACVAHTKNGYYIVTPDNGTLTHVKLLFGIDGVREIDEVTNRYPETKKVSIFHGRDLFGYCAAKLAAGQITWEEVGPAYPLSEIVTLTDPRTADNAPEALAGPDFGALGGALGDAEQACVVLQSSFGHDGGAAAMHGICQSVAAGLPSYDLCHEIPAGDARAASDNLRMALPFWPKGTVFASAVETIPHLPAGEAQSALRADPGANFDRLCAAKLRNGYCVLTPDNGALSHVMRDFGIETVREIKAEDKWLAEELPERYVWPRDALAYAAARLAGGSVAFEDLGPEYPVADVVMLDIRDAELRQGRITGFLNSTDGHFGNLSTNILIEDFERIARFGDKLHVKLSHEGQIVFEGDVEYQKSFGHVPVGAPVLCNGITSYMSLGLNQRSFTARYPVGYGAKWAIEVEKAQCPAD